jgi:TetR/AcrR family transcriptional regulator, cholesterol catabolism regulator
MAGVARKSRRGAILQCFTEMVAERGYDEVSVRDVAEALEISKGTVLHHFGSKAALLEELNAAYMRRRLAEAEEFLPLFERPTDQLQMLVYQMMLSQQDDRAATVAFSREIVRWASDELMVDVRELRDRYSQTVIEVIARGVKGGDFAKVDPRLTALQIFGMCNWTWTWFVPEGARNASQIADQYCRTLIGGLAPGAAPKLKGKALCDAVERAMAANRPDADGRREPRAL